MKNLKAALLMTVIASSAHAAQYDINDLYGGWCLKSLAATLEGERTPDNSFYEFTKEGRLNYKMSFFEQSGDYTIKGDRIETAAMGNYSIIALEKTKMTLKYGTYFFFEKGECR
ncbi:MAG: hypothetical protein REI12_08435 [Pedobacter sp.]|nr:hypothetical protein [Pedobacter sp.]